jgi:hypothetical protein
MNVSYTAVMNVSLRGLEPAAMLIRTRRRRRESDDSGREGEKREETDKRWDK